MGFRKDQCALLCLSPHPLRKSWLKLRNQTAMWDYESGTSCHACLWPRIPRTWFQMARTVFKWLSTQQQEASFSFKTSNLVISFLTAEFCLLHMSPSTVLRELGADTWIVRRASCWCWACFLCCSSFLFKTTTAWSETYCSQSLLCSLLCCPLMKSFSALRVCHSPLLWGHKPGMCTETMYLDAVRAVMLSIYWCITIVLKSGSLTQWTFTVPQFLCVRNTDLGSLGASAWVL